MSEERTVVNKASGRPPLDPGHQAIVEERKARNKVGRPRQTTRDKLMHAQYSRLSRLQPLVFDRLESALADRDDPQHELALDILAKRAIPLAFTEALAKQEFKSDDERPQAPVITINVGSAKPEVDIVSEQ